MLRTPVRSIYSRDRPAPDFWDAVCVVADWGISVSVHRNRRNLFHATLTVLAAALIGAGIVITLIGNGSNLNTGILLLGAVVALAAVILHAARTPLDDVSTELRLLLKETPSTAGFSGLTTAFWRRRDANTTTAATPSAIERTPTPTTELASSRPNAGICAIDAIGTVTFANRVFRHLCQIKERELLGKRIDTLPMLPEVRTALMNLVAQRNGPALRKIEVRVNHLPDTVRYFELLAEHANESAVKNLSDNPEDLILTITEITERRALEAHLLEAQKLAGLGSLVSGMAHTLSNTLTAILGQLDLLPTTTPRDGGPDVANSIRAACQHGGEMLAKLVQYATGRPTTPTPCSVPVLLERSVGLLRNLLRESINLTIVHSSGTELGAKINQELLTQALTNVLLNAQEAYGEKAGAVTIETALETLDEMVSTINPAARSGQYVRVRVTDGGEGMSPEALRRAGEPLFTTRRDQGHTGLGLASAQAILRSMDGFMVIESTPGLGTVVTMYLPQVPLSAQRSNDKSESIAAQTSSDETLSGHSINQSHTPVLVVEDDEMVRPVMARMLTALGYEVTCCDNAEQALDLIDSGEAKEFRLALVDLVLPQMNGTELLALLHQRVPQCQTLVMTGYGSTPGERIADSEVLAKPFDLATLARSVERALDRCTHGHSGPSAPTISATTGGVL